MTYGAAPHHDVRLSLSGGASLLPTLEAASAPTTGTPVLPIPPAAAVATGRGAAVPTLIGSPADEHRYFTSTRITLPKGPLTEASYAAQVRGELPRSAVRGAPRPEHERRTSLVALPPHRPRRQPRAAAQPDQRAPRQAFATEHRCALWTTLQEPPVLTPRRASQGQP